MADILKWLATCLEPDTVLPGGISDETERILLIRSAAEFFVTKAGVKLNPRRLYASSAAAAAELIKITTLLMNAPTDIEKDDEPLMLASPMMDLGDKVNIDFTCSFIFNFLAKLSSLINFRLKILDEQENYHLSLQILGLLCTIFLPKNY